MNALAGVERSIEAHNNAPHEFTQAQRLAYYAYNNEARRLNSALASTTSALRTCLAEPTPGPASTTTAPGTGTAPPTQGPPAGDLGARGEAVFLQRSGATDLNAAWRRPGGPPRLNFPGLDATSSTELTQVKAWGPGSERRLLSEIARLSDPGPTSLSTKVVTALSEAADLTRERGATLPIPQDYTQDPLAYVRNRTVFRIPDDQVAGARAVLFADAMAHPQNYGLPRTLTGPQAWTYANQRIQEIGASFEQLSRG